MADNIDLKCYAYMYYFMRAALHSRENRSPKNKNIFLFSLSSISFAPGTFFRELVKTVDTFFLIFGGNNY